MTAKPNGRVAADQAAIDAAPLVPTATPAAGPADHVTTGEIVEFLHHLTGLRSPAVGADPADHVALLARKADLLRRFADQHTRTAAGPPASTTTPPTTTMAAEGRTP